MKDLKFIRHKNGERVSPEDNDIEFDGVGFETVEGPERVRQSVLKIISTALNSNPVIPDYGSDLPSVPGTPDNGINEKIRKSIAEALSFLIEVEESTDPSERIEGVAKLTVSNSTEDPTKKIVNLIVSLVDGSTLPEIVVEN